MKRLLLPRRTRRTRRILRAGLAASAGIVMLAGSVGTAAAAPTPGWRISLTVGPAKGWTTISDVAATGMDDGWAAGTICPTHTCSRISVVVEHWGGHGWRRLPAPPGGAVPLGYAALVGASSARNAWVITDVDPGTARADRWDGRRWVAYRLPRLTTVDQVEVLGPRNAWLFGGRGTNTSNSPYAARFNGRSWHQVRTPAVVDFSTVSASGTMWAVGVKKSAPSGWVLMRWNGRTWATWRWPKLKLARNRTAFPVGITALGPRNVWVEYGIEVEGSSPPVNLGLTHWNGRRWRRIAAPSWMAVPLGMAPDGHGGLWLTLNARDGKALVHYSSGHWSAQRSPSRPNWPTNPVSLAWVPGTRSLWAGGMGGIEGVSPIQGVVLGYSA